MTPCILLHVYRYFGGSCCLRRQEGIRFIWNVKTFCQPTRPLSQKASLQFSGVYSKNALSWVRNVATFPHPHVVPTGYWVQIQSWGMLHKPRYLFSKITLLCNPRALAIAQTLQRHSVAGMGNFLLQCTSAVATTRNCFEHGSQLVILNLWDKQ